MKCYSHFRDTKLKLRDVKQCIQGYTNTFTTKFQILHLSDFKILLDFCLGESGKLNLKMEFDLDLEYHQHDGRKLVLDRKH